MERGQGFRETPAPLRAGIMGGFWMVGAGPGFLGWNFGNPGPRMGRESAVFFPGVSGARVLDL